MPGDWRGGNDAGAERVTAASPSVDAVMAGLRTSNARVVAADGDEKSGRGRTRNDAPSSENNALSGEIAAKALHLPLDFDLRLLIDAWPDLSAECRRCIIAIACQ